jgi:type II secretory pathway component GspD/PulD (secretin)
MKKLLIAFLMLFSLIANAETEFQIITLQHRFAADLLPIISPMVGEDGTATGINNQLILRASPSRMREIEQTIAELDIIRVNRRISIRSNNNSQRQLNRTEASGNVKIGKTTISNRRNTLPNSGNINIERNSSRISQNSTQFVNVIDGERAFIRVGQIVPFTHEWISITRRYIQIERYTDWHEISTGFAVRPRSIGNQIELEITPRIAKANSHGFIDFEELSTTIRVSLGEWVDIGGTMQSRDDISRKILGLRQSPSQQSSGLMVKVD